MKVFKKIILIILLLFVLIIALGIAWFAWASHANKMKLKSDSISYECGNSDAPKALIVYQKSRTDFAENVMKSYAKKVSEKGYNVTVNHPGDYMPKDVSEYDIVIFQSPVYMAATSPVMNDYISSINNFGDAKLVFIATGMLESEEEFSAIEELFNDHKLDYLFKITQSDYKKDNNYAWNEISKILD